MTKRRSKRKQRSHHVDEKLHGKWQLEPADLELPATADTQGHGNPYYEHTRELAKSYADAKAQFADIYSLTPPPFSRPRSQDEYRRSTRATRSTSMSEDGSTAASAAAAAAAAAAATSSVHRPPLRGNDAEALLGMSSEQQPAHWSIRLVIYVSFVVNVALFLMKMGVAISSFSFAIIASALDSFLDLLSGSILLVTSRLIQKNNPYNYPAGKSRLEPLGIVVFASCMFTATFLLMIESVKALIVRPDPLDLQTPGVVVFALVIVLKLALFIGCRVVLCSHQSASVAALAQDHGNDVLSNALGLTTALLATRFPDQCWFLDPAGAIIIALYIMGTWGVQGVRHSRILVGKSAPPSFLNLLTVIAWNHSPFVLAIDTVRAFHFAHGFLVEVDIVLDQNMRLKKAHDIGESLQFALERLDSVERAFVHLDYEWQHQAEHTQQHVALPYHLKKRLHHH